MKVFFVFRLATLALLFALSLSAQSIRGTLTGVVTDATQAAIPGADVVVTNTATNSQHRVQTSGTGVYTVAELPYGTYTVTVSSKGFKTAEASGVVITVNQMTRLDVTLEVGEVVERIEVTGVTPLLITDNATVQASFNDKMMKGLPLALGTFSVRSPEAFTFLTPGVIGSGFLTTINGGQTFSNEVLLDGGSAGRGWSPGDFDESAPSIEALGEFTIKTNNFSAEYGRTGSSVTSFAYKSGTNELHGSAYSFIRNEAFNAKGFYQQAKKDRKFDYGGTLGGPIYIPKVYDGRNKTFFFFSLEFFRTDLLYDPNPSRWPTALQKQGDFSQFLDLPDPVQIHDPTAGVTYPGNLIPKSQWDSVSTYSLQFFPKPNQVDPGTGWLSRYYNPQFLPVRNVLTTGVLDHNITDNQKAHFSWSRRDNRRRRDPVNGLPGSNPFTQLRRQVYNTNQWRASLDSIIRPNLLNHLNFSVDRNQSTNGTVTDGSNFVKDSGLKGVKNTHTPRMNIGGYATLSNTELNIATETRYELADSMTWVKNNHTIKFGMEARLNKWALAPKDNSAGTFWFGSMQTATLGGVGGDGFASYLLGAPRAGALNGNFIDPYVINRYLALFVQDDWKITPKLTLSIGLRWSLEFPRVHAKNKYGGLDIGLPNPGAGNIPGALDFATSKRRAFEKMPWKDIGPRIGLAYALNDKTVIRTGYGVYYNLIYYNDFAGGMINGYNINPSFSTPDGRQPAFRLDNGFPQDYPRPPFKNPDGQNRQNIDYLSGDTAPPYIQSWNFTIERELSRDMKLSVSYVANKGTRLGRGFQQNQTDPKNLKYGDLLRKNINDPAVVAAGITSPYPEFASDWGGGATAWRALLRYPQYNWVNWLNPMLGNSTYNSLQVKLDKRFSNGIQAAVAYTYAKNLTDADTANLWSSTGPQNDFLSKINKSVSANDRPQVLTAAFLYELPVGKGKALSLTGWKNALFGDWTVNAILTYMSGPSLALFATCPSIEQNRGGRCTPDLLQNSAVYGPGRDDWDPNNGKSMLNADAFTIPEPYSYGTTARNNSRIRRMPQYNENLSLLKDVRFGETIRIQFRFEAFNAFNRVYFNRPFRYIGFYDPNKPGNVTRDPRFGTFSGQQNAPRVIQLAAKFFF